MITSLPTLAKETLDWAKESLDELSTGGRVLEDYYEFSSMRDRLNRMLWVFCDEPGSRPPSERFDNAWRRLLKALKWQNAVHGLKVAVATGAISLDEAIAKGDHRPQGTPIAVCSIPEELRSDPHRVARVLEALGCIAECNDDSDRASTGADPIADQGKKTSEPLALDDVELLILRTLAKKTPHLLKLYTLEAETNIGRKTIGKRVQRLIIMNLICRPKGKRGGATLTEYGRDLMRQQGLQSA